MAITRDPVLESGSLECRSVTTITIWKAFTESAPGIAAVFTRRYAATGNLCILATLRSDGFPRISPIKTEDLRRPAVDELIRTALTARGDSRQVVADLAARYWGVGIAERTLVPADGAVLFEHGSRTGFSRQRPPSESSRPKS